MKYILITLLVFFSNSLFAQLSVGQLKTENLIDPVGIDLKEPRFNWQLISEKRNVLQTAYEIKVFNNKKEIWTSGKKNSDQSIWVKYKGAPLKSNQRYHWQVRVWDNHGNISAWSKLAFFHTAFLNKNDWKARWIEPGFQEEKERPSPIFRKEFNTGKKIKKATAFISAHGLYEAYLNGNKIGDAYFTPGWTSYNKRLQYQVYDVTSLIKSGQNVIGAILGNGWYRGELVWKNNRDIYGSDIAFIFQLEIEYKNGKKEKIISDNTWKSSIGEIQFSEFYHGEIIDARKEKAGWLNPNYDDKNWMGVKEVKHNMDVLLATYNEPIKKQELIKPIKIIKSPNNETILDFGQNLVGWVMVKASGQSGDKIILTHSEVLDKNGNFYRDNIRYARQQNTYILKGGETEVFEPHFTWQGFRYIRVDEFPGEIKKENFTAVALHSDIRPAGEFLTSDSLINQLQSNIRWGQKGNFLDVPLDCPQRDERLGWTGDAQAFSRTAMFNYDVHNFFAKWLRDLEADQQPSGSVPYVIPQVMRKKDAGSAGWADAATIVPWNLFLAYGDTLVLTQQYKSMKKWVDFMLSKSNNYLWNTGFHFGDWQSFRVDDDEHGRSAFTDKYFISQCFMAYSTQLLVNAAGVLGNTQDVKQYSHLLQQIKEAFLNEYITPNGATISNTQTSYVLALQFDMLPEALRQTAADRLVKNIRAYNNHLTTGFLGTPYLCHVLTRFGYPEVAFELLAQKTYPSWLYPITMGATTMWERWNGIKPDSTFVSPRANSFNHYAYGAIGDWMYRAVAGIDQEADTPAYKRSIIKPYINSNFKHVSASLQTVYGKLASSWKIANGRLSLDVVIPANTSAYVYIPTESKGDVTADGTLISDSKDLKVAGEEEGFIIVNVGSGNYHFAVNLH
ncbi:MAG: family 78 glycoside hydrolase catalytic domain [Bacteroidota bacterium]